MKVLRNVFMLSISARISRIKMTIFHMQIIVFVHVSFISCLHHSIFKTNRNFMVIDLQKVGVLLRLNSGIKIRRKFFEGLMHKQHKFGEPVASHLKVQQSKQYMMCTID